MGTTHIKTQHMKKIIACLLLSVLAVSAKSQDKIITSNKDTIHCKIVTIGTTKIFYEQNEGNKIAGKAINLDDVAGYYRDAKSTLSTQNTVYISKQRKQRIAPAHPWVLGVSVGGAYLPWFLDNFPDNEEVDYEYLKNEFQFSSNIHYLLYNSIGVGIQYSFIGSSRNGDHTQVMNPTYPIYMTGSREERQYINYVGPSVLFQHFIGSKHKFQFSETLSGGWINYRNEEQFSMDVPAGNNYRSNSYNALGVGNTIGGTFGLSAEYYVQPYLSVGIAGSFLYCKLKKLSIDYKNSEGNNQNEPSQELPYALNLSRIDYSLALRFHL